MDLITLGTNIRKERKKQGLTIEKLAEKVDIGENFLGKIERGDGTPSLDTTVAIAKALGVGLDHLLGNVSYEAEYKLIRAVVEMNKLPDANKDRFVDFIHANVKYFRECGAADVSIEK